MGQKVHPTSIRLGIIRDWSSKCYASGKEFVSIIHADLKLRKFLEQRFRKAGVSNVRIERSATNVVIVTIFTARPGMIIGRGGKEADKLRTEISKIIKVPVRLNVEEVKKPELDATLTAQSVAQQLENRVMFRRAMKRAVSSALRLGAKGVKIKVSGRLGGAEIARNEWYREGRVPLHTLRADVDYGFAEAMTTYGVIGVKVWIFKGEVFDTGVQEQKETAAEAAIAEA